MTTAASNGSGYLKIIYRIPAAMQRLYHPHPGKRHNGARRFAYLPDTVEGRDLLLRFQYAFLHGHCFDVGYSLGTGLDDQVTWSLVLPHKTGVTGGPRHFRFPDPMYLPRASLALDQLGVPKDPQVCRDWIINHPSFSTTYTGPPLQPMAANGAGSGMMVASTTTSTGLTPPGSTAGAALPSSQNTLVLSYDAMDNNVDVYSQYLEPVVTSQDADNEEECPICISVMTPTADPNTTDVVCIKKCKHRFHKLCIIQMLEAKHIRCPTCREPIGVIPHGQGPSGNLKITLDYNRRCRGCEYDSDGVIQLYYNIPGGIQLGFMENPGQAYSGTYRTAYLPHNESGRKLLARLKFAFTHGLTFRVGTSLTTGRSNQTTWTSIHHKTSLSRGVHGYPDPQYLMNCNNSLDALRVPRAEDCG